MDILRQECINIVNRTFDRAIANLQKTRRLNCREVFTIVDKNSITRIATEVENQLIENLFFDIKNEWNQQNITYNLILEGTYYNYLIKELNDRLKLYDLIYVKTELVFSLFDDKSNDKILQLYKDRFGEMSLKDIESQLNNKKQEINNRILKQIDSKNSKATLKIHPLMNYELSCEINAILDDYLEEDTESITMDLEKATSKYRNRRKELSRLLI